MQVSIGVTRPDSRCSNDCSVRAMANGLGYSYEQAATVCKQNGRKRKNTGMKDYEVFHMLNSKPDKLRRLDDMCAHQSICSTLFSLNPAKSYLVCVLKPGHIFAIRHGVILDGQTDFFSWSRHFLRAYTVGVWEVLEPEQLTLNFEG